MPYRSLKYTAALFYVLASCSSTTVPQVDPALALPELVGRKSVTFRLQKSGDLELLAQDVEYTNGTRASTLAGLFRASTGVNVKLVVLSDALPNALSENQSAPPLLPEDLRMESTGVRVNNLSFLKSIGSNDAVSFPSCRDKDALHALLSIEAPNVRRGNEAYFRTGEIVCLLPYAAGH